MAEGATLLRGHKFYLARTLSRGRRKALLELIQSHGGEVVDSPIGATQLVECEMLDARQNWVAATFVEDSVAFGALQDPTQYTGAVFTMEQTTKAAEAAKRLPRGRHKFTLEDDARMLHFVKTHHNWQAMGPVPESAWNLAEKQKVTTHSGSSMHEHFRKQLRRKTPKEQRAIMAQALVEARAQPPPNEAGSDVEVVEPPDQSLASPGPSATQLSKSLSTGESAISPIIAGVNEARPANGEEVESDGRGHSHMNAMLSSKETPLRASGPSSPQTRAEASDRTPPPGQAAVARPTRRERAQTRKPLSPPSISQKPQRADGTVEDAVPEQAAPHSSFAAPTPQQAYTNDASLRRVSNSSAQASASPAVPSVPPPPPRATQTSSTPAFSSPQGTQPMSKKQQKQKRKRKTPGDDTMSDRESTPSSQPPEVDDSDGESNESNGRGDKGVFFESVWTNLLADPSKRLLLQPFFGLGPLHTARTGDGTRGISTNTAVATTYPKRKRQKSEEQEREASLARDGADPYERSGVGLQSQTLEVERATEHEADAIICQLQLETNQDMPSVVHALFYSSGDAETARAFLKGASPTGIWSPGDDLLLVNLMAEGVDRSAVDEAVERGDFAAMRVLRDTEEILARIHFLL